MVDTVVIIPGYGSGIALDAEQLGTEGLTGKNLPLARLRVTFAGTVGGDGALLDGVSSAIKATVLDYTNSNPLAVRLTDTNGDYAAAGGGTEYSDGAARGTATGKLFLADDGTNIQSVRCDANGYLQVQQQGTWNVGVTGSVAVTGTFWQTTQPVSIAATVSVDVTDKPARDLGKVDIASLDQYTPVSGRLPVDGSGVTQPISGTVTANPATYGGKTLTYVPVAQGAAGTTQLAAADGTKKHKVLGCVLALSADGTLKFIDSSGDLTGAMDIAGKGGFVVPTSLVPITETGAVNRTISIVTTGGAAKGVVVLLTEA